MKKFNLSHSKILDTLDDDSAEAQQLRDEHLDEIARRMEGHGARVVEKTRYNVVVEMNDGASTRRKFGDVDGDGDRDFDDLRAIVSEPIHMLFDIVLDTAEGFFGFVEAKAGDLKDWVDHIETEHEDKWHSGS